MLQFEKTKRSGGLVLWGQYGDLRALHELIMDVSERSHALHSEGLIVGLAHELRKSWEGRRLKTQVEIWDDTVTLYGSEHVWPTLFVQIALLRTGLAFSPSSYGEQSVLYGLEHILDRAAVDAFGSESANVMAVYRSLIGESEEVLESRLGSRVSYFLGMSPAQRRGHLPAILKSLTFAGLIGWEGASGVSTSGYINPAVFEGHGWEVLDAMDGSVLKL